MILKIGLIIDSLTIFTTKSFLKDPITPFACFYSNFNLKVTIFVNA